LQAWALGRSRSPPLPDGLAPGCPLAEAQSCDEQPGHAACIITGAAAGADAETADATKQFVGVHAGADLTRPDGSVEQLGADGDEAAEKVGVQSLEGGFVGLQRRREAGLVTRKSTKRLIRRARAACGVLLLASSTGPASAHASTWCR
jgi:hypothetical protein